MSRKRSEAGQVLVLFAGGLIGILALCALAIDLSQVFSIQRTEKSVADAAALAGAQDLQTPGSRGVGPTDYVNARTHALNNLISRLGASGPSATVPGSNCNPDPTSGGGNIIECTLVGTPYQVSIKTPSPSYVNVDPTRAVQVMVRQADVPLNFARLFGQHDWNVAETSVAGLDYGGQGQYAVITLMTPTGGRSYWPSNVGITLNGGCGSGGGTSCTPTTINVEAGDIGMNTGDNLNGNNVRVSVADGYFIRYYGATATMTSHAGISTPPGVDAFRQLRALVPDPGYWPRAYTRSGAAINPTPDTVNCAAFIAEAQAAGYTAAANADVSSATCYKPGVYSTQLSVANGNSALLEPGVYWLDQGVNNQGVLVGGWKASSTGVALVVPEGIGFTSNGGGGGSANVLALNRGTTYASGAACDVVATCATAALMPDGTTKVETNTKSPMVLTVIVPGVDSTGNPLCPVVIPAPCGTTTTTIQWTGSGGASVTSVGGVVYAPADNITVAGNDPIRGYVGQLVAWTITYSGQSTLNQHYPGGVLAGFVHLDAACSGGTSPCTP